MEFLLIRTNDGKPVKDTDGNDVVLLSNDYTLKTSYNLETAVSEVTFFKDDILEKLPGFFVVTRSLGYSLLWNVKNSYFGGIVTKYTIRRDTITLHVSSPQWLLDKMMLTSYAFLSPNPARRTIRENYNSEWTYSRSGKPVEILAQLMRVKSPIPATSDTLSPSWGGGTTEIAIDPVNLHTAKEKMQEVLEQGYAPMVNWTYMLIGGVYTLMLTHSIDSIYSTSKSFVGLNSFLPENFAIDIDLNERCTTGWCSSRAANTTDQQIVYASYSHVRVDIEPVNICKKTSVDNYGGDICMKYARALEEQTPLTSAKITIPISEALQVENSSESVKASQVTSLNYMVFENVLQRGDMMRCIVTATETTKDSVTLHLDKIYYNDFTFSQSFYWDRVSESLASPTSRDIFSELAKENKRLNYVSKITP